MAKGHARAPRGFSLNLVLCIMLSRLALAISTIAEAFQKVNLAYSPALNLAVVKTDIPLHNSLCIAKPGAAFRSRHSYRIFTLPESLSMLTAESDNEDAYEAVAAHPAHCLNVERQLMH